MRRFAIFAAIVLLPACLLDRGGRAQVDGQGASAGQGSGGFGQGGNAPGGTGGQPPTPSGGNGGGGGSPSTVGNCVIDAGEACDDCNGESGDGCDAQGQIEPGWVCMTAGEPCQHVSGVAPGSGAPIDKSGDQGATPLFLEACPAGMLLVGLEATDSGDWPGGGDYLSYVAPRCAAPEVDALGRFRWSGVVTGAIHGGIGDCCVTNTTAYPPLTCAGDAFVVGYRAWVSNYVTQIELSCDGFSFDGSAIAADGSPSVVGPMGSGTGTAGSTLSCPAGSYAMALSGSAGAVMDLIGLECAPIAHTLCGDGTINGAEICDDGNALSGDGCSDRCVPDL